MRIDCEPEPNYFPSQLAQSKLKKAQTEGRALNVKFGVDATGRELHLGHAVPMIMAGRLQRMGHQLQIIVGDFTARIGDPSVEQMLERHYLKKK